MPVVGMVGGGQLARMTHQASITLGSGLRVLCAGADDSAALVAADVTIGDHDDFDDLRRFATGCDVITFDHEHVPPEHLQALAASGVAVRPSPEALVHAQDKRVMRERLSALGLPVPRWSTDPDELPRPYVVKASRGGYDGRGVWFVGEGDDLPTAGEFIVEERVTIARELAVQVARSPSGQAAVYPVVQTVQQDGICREVLAPAPELSADTAVAIQQLGLRIAGELDITGMLAVELFETADGVLINELAMRPHNSGHWTIEGARTSQFEQHLRAVSDLPLGDTTATARHAVMVNIIGGSDPDVAGRLTHVLAADPGARVHLYGKAARPGRKLGHVTVLGDDLDDVRERARRAAEDLRGEPG
ncbi:MAG: 5-(carboxyamino)imidazole ribonucleotide synthase [Frankiales bacterium]|jgi:5-(carboxyamino)imidazole ribonucleotide synthase|nr:5-(carboxyamino)imidazole ribonucleotide synthase [Frankiales bacterium]